MKKANLLAWATCALLAATATATAQTFPQPLGINDVAPLDTVTQTIEYKAGGKKYGIVYTTMIWAHGQSAIELSIDAGSLVITGDLDLFQATPATELFDFIPASAVDIAIDGAYVPCPATGTAATGVTLASCVTRNSADFDVYGTDLVRRAYSYACPSSGRVATQTGVTGVTTCGGGSEGTSSAASLN